MSKIKCPKCDPTYEEDHSPVSPIEFDAPGTSFRCQDCKHKWKHPRKKKPEGAKHK